MIGIEDTFLAALAGDGVVVSGEQWERLTAFVGLVRGYGERMALVSRGDLGELEKHVVDSLALAAVVRGLGCSGVHVDVGSGAGFPGVVLGIVFGEREVVLVERSEKKAGFLEVVVRELGLGKVRVVCGEFPGAVVGLTGVGSVSARAVERPEKVWRQVLRWLPVGAVFVSQLSGGPERVPEGVVELGVPGLGTAGWRRGGVRVFGGST